MERDEEEKMISIKWVITNKGTEEHPIAKARLAAREFISEDKRGELFAGTPGLMARRTVFSRALTKCENGLKRSIHAGRCQDSLLAWRRKEVAAVRKVLPLEDPLSDSGRYVGIVLELRNVWSDAPMVWQDHLRETPLAMKFHESVTHPGVFHHETRDILLFVEVDDLLVHRCTRRADAAEETIC